MALPRKLKNFVLFNDGESYLGEVPEIVLPKLTRKTEDYRTGGMPGPVKLDFGLEGLQLEWTAAGYIKSLLKQWGARKHDAVGLRFAGALQADDDDTVHALEVATRGRHNEIDFGTAKAGEATAIKVQTALSYYKLTMDGERLIEIDMVNGIEFVGGVDLMAAVRTALGLA